MHKCALAAIALLAGCASPEVATATAVTLADGRAGHRLDCSRAPRGQSDCLSKGSELCPVGYYALHIGNQEMTIRCKMDADE